MRIHRTRSVRSFNGSPSGREVRHLERNVSAVTFRGGILVGSGRCGSVAADPQVASTAMKAFWLQIRGAAAVLLAATLLLHTPLAVACTPASAGMPCCPMSGQNSTHADGSSACATGCLYDCAATPQVAYGQAAQTTHAVALETNSDQGVHLLAPVWPESPVAAHLRPQPQGPPPITLLTALVGRYTYLATLRLRI